MFYIPGTVYDYVVVCRVKLLIKAYVVLPPGPEIVDKTANCVEMVFLILLAYQEK